MSVITSKRCYVTFFVTVKAAPHECVIRTGQPYTYLKAENEARFY